MGNNGFSSESLIERDFSSSFVEMTIMCDIVY